MWLLAIEDDEGTTTFHRLSGERVTLGRAPDSDVVLAQYNVSRRHGRLEREGDGWRYFDENSSNGSYFNGCRLLVPTPVGPHDALQIAGYRLTFRAGVQTNVPTPMPHYVPPARLRVLAGPGEGTEYTIARNELVTLGRADECSVRLLHERLCGVHARVRPLAGGRYEIVDESGRGVVVNGRLFACKVLEGGDTIALAGVSLLRYFERGQAPDPRFDRVASEGALEAARDLGADPLARSGPVSGAPAALGEGEAPEGRVEMVGPRSVPAPAPVPVSFRLAREATVLPRQQGESAEQQRPSRRISFTVETPARPAKVPAATARVPLDSSYVMTPTGLRRDRVINVIKRRRALEAAVTLAVLGSAVALARGVVHTTVERAAALRPAAVVESSERAKPERAPAAGGAVEGSRVGAAEAGGPSVVTASVPPPAGAEGSGRDLDGERAPAPSASVETNRARLEARLRGGGASPAELRALVDVCTRDGDEACARRALDQLARAAGRD